MRVTLQVGERRFETSTDILNGAAYFEAYTSERWESSKQPDGSYWVDADPEVFTHILRHLRHGIFPVFYDNRGKGHDFTLYLAVLQLAEYFLIPPLVEWLKERNYLSAITVAHSASITTGEEDIHTTTNADTTVEYHPAWKMEKVYVCPRGIGRHRGNPRGCGIKCSKEQGDREPEYEDELVLTTLVIRRRTVFDERLCLGE